MELTMPMALYRRTRRGKSETLPAQFVFTVKLNTMEVLPELNQDQWNCYRSEVDQVKKIAKDIEIYPTFLYDSIEDLCNIATSLVRRRLGR
jgi:hypothetical protein